MPHNQLFYRAIRSYLTNNNGQSEEEEEKQNNKRHLYDEVLPTFSVSRQ